MIIFHRTSNITRSGGSHRKRNRQQVSIGTEDDAILRERLHAAELAVKEAENQRLRDTLTYEKEAFRLRQALDTVLHADSRKKDDGRRSSSQEREESEHDN